MRKEEMFVAGIHHETARDPDVLAPCIKTPFRTRRHAAFDLHSPLLTIRQTQ
jgi:hypothetical protein